MIVVFRYCCCVLVHSSGMWGVFYVFLDFFLFFFFLLMLLEINERRLKIF